MKVSQALKSIRYPITKSLRLIFYSLGRIFKLLAPFIGTLPQWVAAIVAVLAFRSPVFQNQLLKEENAELTLKHHQLQHVDEIRQAVIWKGACDKIESSGYILLMQILDLDTGPRAEARVRSYIAENAPDGLAGMSDQEKTRFVKWVAEFRPLPPIDATPEVLRQRQESGIPQAIWNVAERASAYRNFSADCQQAATN